jgi:broad specificity phosphatase PhoE
VTFRQVLTRDEIELGYPGFLAAWRKPDGFESDADVVDRATAALLRRARAFVGMDSGPAHMAAAVGIPVAVIAAHLGLSRHEDAIRIAQDGAQLAVELYGTPTPGSAPWLGLEFEGVSIDHYEAASRLEMLITAHQVVA